MSVPAPPRKPRLEAYHVARSSAKPAMDPAYLSDAIDRTVLRESVRLARGIMAQRPLDRYRGEEFRPGRRS